MNCRQELRGVSLLKLFYVNQSIVPISHQNQSYPEHYTRTLIECHSPGTTYVRKRGSLTRRVRYDWTACFPCNLPPQPPKSGERFAVTIMLPGRVRRRRYGIYRGYSR